MSLTKDVRKKIFKEFGGEEKNTGSAEAQIALFTNRITDITGHLQNNNKKDFSASLSLVKLVGKRKKLLKYLSSKDINRYREIIAKLKLRK